MDVFGVLSIRAQNALQRAALCCTFRVSAVALSDVRFADGLILLLPNITPS
jgi:hypothetical protein